MEVAVIDLGYNSIRLSLFQRSSNGNFRSVGSMKDFTRLGDGVDEGGEIKEGRVNEAERVLSTFRKVLEKRGVSEVFPLGTSAFRLARNGEEVAKRLSKSLGWDVIIVSGEEEGRLSALASINSVPITDGVIFELGGGSLEVTYVSGREIGKIYNFPLGALRLIKIMKTEDRIRKEIRSYLYSLPSWLPPSLIGSGGNLRAIAKFLMKVNKVKFKHVHGYQVSSATIKSLARTLWSMRDEEISRLPGIGEQRSVTVKAAILVIEELINLYDVPYLTVSELGMREGKLMKGEELSVPKMRGKWLDSFSEFSGVQPPESIRFEVEKLTGSDLAADAGFLAHVFMESGWSDPFNACYQYVIQSLFPGFLQRELGYLALICKGATEKVKKKDLQRLGIEGRTDKINQLSRVMKKVVKSYPLGVY
ncbi:MAG: Ppx/GppA phosphatase family protein [Metallosphaera sp.]